jgi:hypothetical protein
MNDVFKRDPAVTHCLSGDILAGTGICLWGRCEGVRSVRGAS